MVTVLIFLAGMFVGGMLGVLALALVVGAAREDHERFLASHRP